MSKKIFCLIVALLAFLIGAIGVRVSGVYPKIETYIVETLSTEPDIKPVSTLESEPTFIPQMDACGERSNFHTFLKKTTGETIEVTGELYPSPALANQALSRRLISAKEIIERTPIYDDKGKQVGERAVVVFPASASILWTYDSVFSSINAPSVKLALEFEFEKAFEHK